MEICVEGGEVAEREQHLAILRQALGDLLVFQLSCRLGLVFGC